MTSDGARALGDTDAEEPSHDGETGGSTRDPSELIDQMLRAQEEIAELRAALERERERAAHIDRFASATDVELQATRRTWSWRLTAPLRLVRRVQLALAGRRERPPMPQPLSPVEPPARTETASAPSTHSRDRERALAALWGRAATATELLGGTRAEGSEALSRYATAVAGLPNGREVGRVAWLAALVALGRHPTPAEVERARRAIRAGAESTAGYVLEECERTTSERGPCESVLVPVVGEVVVDLSTSLGSTDLAGVQRVVRSVIPRWSERHQFTAIAWDDAATGFVVATDDRLRSLIYGEELGHPEERTGAHQPELVLPWDCRYVVPELAVGSHGRMLAMRALVTDGPLTGTALVGYDLIPVTAPETVEHAFVAAFGDYLSVLKHTDKVAAISHSAVEEFRTFGRLLASQGLDGPDVIACPLPQEAIPTSEAARAELRSMLDAGDRPLVLVVGSHEPRKNHLAVLAAAEQLWSEGRSFHLAFFGGLSWGSAEFESEVERLQDAGAPTSVHRRVSEDLLWAGYAEARFTVFPSLVEGYGLPVAESLSAGCPALVSNHGPMAELAADGGAVLVDPRDTAAIAASMRRLLTDDELVERLRSEAAARPHTSWDDYAARLWDALTGAPPDVAQDAGPSRRIAETTDV